jgi:hypothetical protein
VRTGTRTVFGVRPSAAGLASSSSSVVGVVMGASLGGALLRTGERGMVSRASPGVPPRAHFYKMVEEEWPWQI